MRQQLVGREAELAAVSEFLDDAARGAGALILEGEAGIGKTALWREGLGLLERRDGIAVLACQPAEAETDLSFAALGDLLGPTLTDVLPDLPDPQRRTLEVALLVREDPSVKVDHRTVSVAVLGAVRALALARPLVLAMDDVQWIDRPSGRALEFALRRLRDEPVSIFAALRASGDDSTPFGLDRTQFDQRLRRIRIGPLGVAATRQLLHQRLGSSFPRPTLVRIHEASGGNPFYALEIARSLLARESMPAVGESLPVPSRLQELVRNRLFRLSSGARHAVLLAALASRPTISEVTAAIGDVDGALKDIDEAVAAAILEVRAGQIRFTHPLLASTALDESSLQLQRRAHLALSSVTSDPEQRARHLALATPTADSSVADALDEAAGRARARGAPESAAELGELAIRCTPPEDVDGAVRRRIAAADDLTDAGDPLRALSLLGEAETAASSGPRHAAVLWRLERLSDNPDENRLATALAEAADDHHTVSSIHQMAALTHALFGDLGTATTHAEIALREAELTDDPDLQAQALGFRVAGLAFQGEVVSAQLQDQARALRDRVSRIAVYFSPEVWIANQRMWRGDAEGARPLLQQSLERCLRLGDEASHHGVLYHVAELECHAGRFELAAATAHEALALAHQQGLQQDLSVMLYMVAVTETYLGNTEGARTAANEGLSIATRLEDQLSELHHRRALGFLELSLGNLGEAEQWLAGLPELAQKKGLLEPGHLQFEPDLIESLIASGDLDRATELLDAFEAKARDLSHHPWATAVALRCRGVLAAAVGSQSAAIETIDLAIAAHETIAEPFDLARMHLVAGAIHRRFKQKRTAREFLERAIGAFEQLQTPLWTEKARGELARTGLRPPGPGGLTPTEQRIAGLVVTGRTNQEIAGEMFLSLRTVEANLTRTYRKLGVRSRTELVAKLGGAARASGG